MEDRREDEEDCGKISEAEGVEMKDLNWKNIVAGALLVVALIGSYRIGTHLWQDHVATHFQANMLEAVRQAVLAQHPNLQQEAPPAPEPTPEAPIP
jgi:hypothetical protein